MKEILLILLFVSTTCVCWAKKYEPPKITAMEAVQTAQAYVIKNKIKIHHASFISKVIYMNVYNEYKPAYWSIMWQIVPGAKNALLEIRIYNNGKIEPYYAKRAQQTD